MKKLFSGFVPISIVMCILVPVDMAMAQHGKLTQWGNTELTGCEDAETLLVYSTGTGSDFTKAIDDARGKCLQWYLSTWVLGDLDRVEQPHPGLQEKLLASLDKYVLKPPASATPAGGVGITYRRRTEKGTQVSIITKLNRRKLEEDLVKMGLLKDEKKMMQALTVVILPGKNTGSKSWPILSEVASNYLHRRGWTLVSQAPKAMTRHEKAKTKAVSVVPLSPADIEVVLSIDSQEKDFGPSEEDKAIIYTVAVSSSLTVPGVKIAGATSASTPAPVSYGRKAAMRAVTEAVCKADLQMFSYMRTLAESGFPVIISVKNPPKGFGLDLNASLKKISGRVKVLGQKDGKLAFQTRYKGGGGELALELLEELQKNHKYKSLSVTTSTRYKIEFTFHKKKNHR